jgi:hypothetical protein
MLSPHEFATLMLVADAPEQIDLNREEFGSGSQLFLGDELTVQQGVVLNATDLTGTAIQFFARLPETLSRNPPTKLAVTRVPRLVLKFVNSASRVHRSAILPANSASVPCEDNDKCNPRDNDLSPEERQRNWQRYVQQIPVAFQARCDVPDNSLPSDRAILSSNAERTRRHR